MRTYPRNSPQAAARIVALALTSDGHVSNAEERALESLDIAVTIADNYLANGEISLLAAVFNAWGLKPNQTASRHIQLPGTPRAHARTAAIT